MRRAYNLGRRCQAKRDPRQPCVRLRDAFMRSQAILDGSMRYLGISFESVMGISHDLTVSHGPGRGRGRDLEL